MSHNEEKDYFFTTNRQRQKKPLKLKNRYGKNTQKLHANWAVHIHIDVFWVESTENVLYYNYLYCYISISVVLLWKLHILRETSQNFCFLFSWFHEGTSRVRRWKQRARILCYSRVFAFICCNKVSGDTYIKTHLHKN